MAKSAFSGKHTNASEVSGLAAHRIDITECVGSSNLTERVRIVHHGRKEVDGLHQRSAGPDQIHSGVVGLVEADQNIRVMLPG